MGISSLKHAWFYTYLKFLSHVWVNRIGNSSSWALSLSLGVQNHPRTSCVFLLALVKFLLPLNTWLWGPYPLPTLSFLLPQGYLNLSLLGWLWVTAKYYLVSTLPGGSWNESLAMGIPWRLSGKESACQCRRHGFDSWPGKITHAAKQLSPCATTTEPVL